jgi:hypothetical protein
VSVRYRLEEPDASVGELVSRLTEDLGVLVRDHIQLAKEELKAEAKQAGSGVGMLGGGAVAGWIALVLLSMALAWGLAEVMAPWLAFLIVGVVWAVVAAALAATGRKKIEEVDPVPRETVREIKEDQRWLNEQRNIEERRQRIGHTVDEIENRVIPSRVAARTTDRVSDRIGDWRDRIMGSNDGENTFAEAGQRMSETPQMIRRKAQGNPMAAGLIAFGGGLLVGSMLPETKAEHRAVERMEPVIREAEPELREAGRQVVEDVKDVAKETAQELRDSAADSAERIRSEARST